MSNPYAPPSAELERRDAPSPLGSMPRAVGAERGLSWMMDGYRLVFRSPFIWIVNLFFFFVIAIILSVVPVIGPFASSILGPALSAGLMLGCHALAHGESLTVGHLFAGFSRHAKPLIQLGALYTAGSFALGLLALAPTIGTSSALTLLGRQADPAASLALFESPMFWIGVLLVMALSLPLVMAYWFAPLLIVLGGLPPLEAMKQSFFGCLKNILPFLVWSVVALIFTLLSLLPLGLGLIVTMPALIAAMYASARDVFAPA